MKNPLRRRPSEAAFTLIELIVVIGIILAVIGLLLPALARSQKEAYQVECASNMRQIGLAIIQYIGDNHGNFPPALISNNSHKTQDPNNPYPDGWFWAAELVNQHYISAPNILRAGAPNTLYFSHPSPFECPSALMPDEAAAQAGLAISDAGAFPTDPKNSVGAYGMATNPRSDGRPPYGVVTWYQLCCVSTLTRSNAPQYPGGATDAPFIFYNVTKGGGNVGAQLALPGYRRNISQVKHSSILCMIVEASFVNWAINGTKFVTTAPKPVRGEVLWMPSLAARHGPVSSNGNNAYTNIAFFDGHVSAFATQPIEDFVRPGGVGGGPNIPPALGVVFTLEQDK